MSNYSVILTGSAQKELAELPKQVQLRIIKAAYALAETPFPPGVKKLKGRELRYRIRIGDYRLLYTINGSELIIMVLKIAHRQNAYN